MRRRRAARNKAATLKPKDMSAMMLCGSTWPVSSQIGYTFEARKAQGKNASNRTVKTLTWKSWSPSKPHEAKGSSFNDWNSAIASGASICMSRLCMPFATLLFSISAAEGFCARNDAPKKRAALAARKAVAPLRARQPLRKRPVCKRPLGWQGAATLTDTRTKEGNVAKQCENGEQW